MIADLERAGRLLVAARAVLAGEHQLPLSRWSRAAALLARTALEDWIEHAFAQLEPATPGGSTRAKLICLYSLADQDDAGNAAWAYAALSRACHHHAYELAPTCAEVAHLITSVERLLAAER